MCGILEIRDHHRVMFTFIITGSSTTPRARYATVARGARGPWNKVYGVWTPYGSTAGTYRWYGDRFVDMLMVCDSERRRRQ